MADVFSRMNKWDRGPNKTSEGPIHRSLTKYDVLNANGINK